MTKLESFKLVVETLLLCIGIVYAVVFAWRTWPYPSGALSLVESERFQGVESDTVSVTFDSKFSLGARSNFDVKYIEADCSLLLSHRDCDLHCFDAQDKLSSGRISSGDSFNWSCMTSDIPQGICVLADVRVVGAAPFPTWKESSWWAQSLSCPAQ